MKKISLIVFCLILLLVTGCSSDKEESSTLEDLTSSSKEANSSIDSSGSGKLMCTRDASAGEGIEVDLNYEIEYENGYIQVLHSNEKITSSDSESLDEYEAAYKKIAANYKGLKYYDTEVTRTSTEVINDTVINYAKIDMDKLLDIEGEEDNVIKDGKVALSTWLEFAEQFGTTCEEVAE